MNLIDQLVSTAIEEARENHRAAVKTASEEEAANFRSRALKLASIYNELAQDPSAISKLAEGPLTGTSDPKVQPPDDEDMSVSDEQTKVLKKDSPLTDQHGTDTVPGDDADTVNVNEENDRSAVLKQSSEENVLGALTEIFASVEAGEHPDPVKIASIVGLPPSDVETILDNLPGYDKSAQDDGKSEDKPETKQQSSGGKKDEDEKRDTSDDTPEKGAEEKDEEEKEKKKKGPGGHEPDRSGPPPHGRGQGPGGGRQDGSGMGEKAAKAIGKKIYEGAPRANPNPAQGMRNPPTPGRKGGAKTGGADNESAVSPREYKSEEDGSNQSSPVEDRVPFVSDDAAMRAFTKRQAALVSKVEPLQKILDEKPFADPQLHAQFDNAEEAGVKTTRS